MCVVPVLRVEALDIQLQGVDVILLGLCEDVLEAVISRSHPPIHSSLMPFT